MDLLDEKKKRGEKLYLQDRTEENIVDIKCFLHFFREVLSILFIATLHRSYVCK